MTSRLKKRLGSLGGLALCVCFLTGQAGTADSAEGQSADLVARKDYKEGKGWRPAQIMGRDFWHILGVSMDTQPDQGNWAGTHMRELVDKPLFKESGLNYSCIKNITVPDSNRVSISAMEPHRYFELIDTRPNAPFFIMPHGIRPPYKLMKHFECDNEGYATWRKTHPNFMGCVDGEIDNDFLSAAPWKDYWWPKFKKDCTDQALITTIEKEFPKPQTREELTAQYLKACKGFREFFFNDVDKLNYMRAAHCHDHYFYESGAGVGWLETTNTGSPNGSSNYRHQVSLYFSRGAARQYDKNWAWYIAVFYNGYDDKGKFSGNSTPNYRVDKEKASDAGGVDGPGCGMSPSLLARDMFLAYLGGANFVQHESWWNYLHEAQKDGQKTWDLTSPFGKVWEDWFEFTRKNPDRGASYAPVALLVPFEQGYPNYGGKSWQTFNYERADWMIDAVMFTIMPHAPVTQNGDEGALANSPYGDIYDVIVPNTPGKPVSLEVLNNYKVAAMLGNYPKNKAVAERLADYVRDGGTLLLNIKQVNEFFPVEFLGLERTAAPNGAKAEVKGPVRSTADGKTFTLPDSYEMEVVKLKGATTLLRDAADNVLACKNGFGKGNVIVSTVDCLVPKSGADDKGGYFMDTLVYKKKFPFVEYFLKDIVGEVLPLEVKGDIEYGMNKLDDGWLLYLINNKGVTKFTNKEQALDPSKTAKVEVSLKNIKAAEITELREQKAIVKDGKTNAFTVEVPPGGVKVVKIKEEQSWLWGIF